MTRARDLSQEDVVRLFEYDSAAGALRWRYRPDDVRFNKIWGGNIAGTVDDDGYRRIQVGGVKHASNRCIWIFHRGEIPPGLLVDHRSRDPSDESIGNLRLATDAQNQHNQTPKSGKSSRFKGVRFQPDCRQWRAEIRHFGKRVHLGLFKDEADAARAYDAAAKQFHGEFASVNGV
jgi:hypothetical protein